MKTVRLNAVVSDLAMPGEDGLWLLQQIRLLKRENGGSIPAIAVTAHRKRYAAGAVASALGGPPVSKPLAATSGRLCLSSSPSVLSAGQKKVQRSIRPSV